MAKAKKRKPDMRRIRPSKAYTPSNIAKDLDRNIDTVRRWIRTGLPTLDRDKPTLVDGAVLREWLKAKWQSRRKKCGPDELYCLKCREPRKPRPGTLSFQPRNAKTVAIKALCGECGTRMNQSGSLAKLDEIKARFRAFMPDKQHLTGCGSTSDKRMFSEHRTNGGNSKKQGSQIPQEIGCNASLGPHSPLNPTTTPYEALEADEND